MWGSNTHNFHLRHATTYPMCSVCIVLKHLTPFADIQAPSTSPVTEAGLSSSHSEMVVKGRGVPLAGK